MKKSIFLLALLVCATVTVKAQLVVRPAGNVVLGDIERDAELLEGQPSNDRDTITALKIYGPKDNGGWGRISFGDQANKRTFNVVIGELSKGSNYDTDQLRLQGKNGIYMTYGLSDTLAYFDVLRGNNFKFNCDVTTSGVFVGSDSRFKENVNPLDGALETLDGLKAVTYNLKPGIGNGGKDEDWTPVTEKERRDKEFFDSFHQKYDDCRTRYGFIAQEVKEVMPDLVHTDRDGYMSVDYIGLVPVLVEAIKELRAEVKELRGDDVSFAPAMAGAEMTTAGCTVPRLYQNAPNPFTGETVIRYDLPETVSQAAIYIYDMQGKQIKSLEASPSEGSVTLQGSDLPAGMYIYALIADGREIDSKRMILTK